MKKIKYRIVYNRKKQLDSQGKALVQVEAYLSGKKSYFFYSYLSQAQPVECPYFISL